ncbi:serine hydrolase domain-containing protein [Dactylosporangium sucinum]|uniref:Serine hydrolase n=1 Tax=Dactylosporangium sucinum TaxID=1424081 RepID=A0A917UDB4_9ACTN|nr:serine hydrolase domain-containing protein [Dactylosporangium sucinum]GGM84705.1 serine hydrolase [Dactylosporangium sucinum]
MRPAQRYERIVRRVQAEARVPALSVAVHRADRPLWTFQVGADAGTQLRIGSVTKTFTAVLVMQCRDDGLLDLDDQIARHLPVKAHGELTIGRMLSHLSGLQREPFGDVWDTLGAPDVEGLLAQLDRAEQVLRPGLRFHYSNLAVALLGHLVGRLRGGTWEEVLRDRILEPLGLHDTASVPERPATGYMVDAWSDYAHPERPDDFGAVGPAAQLWSTAADMARWAAFLADPREMDPNGAVLAAPTVEEMRAPQAVTEDVLWTRGFGLGLIVHPQAGPGRIVHVGHDGAMPGFLAGVYGRSGGSGTPGALAVAALGSSGTAREICELPHELLAAVVEEDPADVAPWVPGEPAPPEYRSVLGRWWSEGFELVFSWRDGGLQARGADDPAARPPARFAPVEGRPDLLRTVSGREAGELLRLTRDEDGRVVRMHWATYRVTRTQEAFDGHAF